MPPSKMTFDEFELLPRKPGWKYEFLDGQPHITPAEPETFPATSGRSSSRSARAGRRSWSTCGR